MVGLPQGRRYWKKWLLCRRITTGIWWLGKAKAAIEHHLTLMDTLVVVSRLQVVRKCRSGRGHHLGGLHVWFWKTMISIGITGKRTNFDS